MKRITLLFLILNIAFLGINIVMYLNNKKVLELQTRVETEPASLEAKSITNECMLADSILTHELLYAEKISVSTGIIGEGLESTLLCYQTFGTLDTQWVRFTFDRNNYWKAHYVIDGYLYGFSRMNLMSQKEYVSNLKYIYSGKWSTNKKDLITHE